MRELPVHPMAMQYPWITGEKWESFRDSVEEHGIRVPMLVWKGKVVDGKNRQKAAMSAGKDCPHVELPESMAEADVEEYVDLMNRERRHEDSNVIAAIAAEKRLLEKEQTRRATEGRTEETDDKPSAEVVAARIGSNRRYVQDAVVLYNEAADLHAKVKEGELTVSKAMTELKGRRKEKTPEAKPEPASDRVVDGLGNKVPKWLEKTFADVDEFDAAQRLLTKLVNQLKTLSENGAMYRYLVFDEAQALARQMHNVIAFGKPHAECPYCHQKMKGKGPDKDCDACRGVGYVNRSIYDQAPR